MTIFEWRESDAPEVVVQALTPVAGATRLPCSSTRPFPFRIISMTTDVAFQHDSDSSSGMETVQRCVDDMEVAHHCFAIRRGPIVSFVGEDNAGIVIA